jgi:hypothetical protein
MAVPGSGMGPQWRVLPRYGILLTTRAVRSDARSAHVLPRSTQQQVRCNTAVPLPHLTPQRGVAQHTAAKTFPNSSGTTAVARVHAPQSIRVRKQ